MSRIASALSSSGASLTLPRVIVSAFTTTAIGFRILSLRERKWINYTSKTKKGTHLSSLLIRSVRVKDKESWIGCSSNTSK